MAELVARYPNVRLATAADNGRILEFFERTPMRTSAFDVQYRRRPDFFNLLDYQGDRVFVFVGEDDEGRVCGVSSLSLRPGWVRSRPTTIGYWGDLRVIPDRVRSRVWRRIFTEIVSHAPEIEELADCTHWYTVVIDGNHDGLAALRSRPEQPHYIPIGPFIMRNLVVRLPWAKLFRARDCCKAFAALPADTKALETFFEEENRRTPLGFRGEFGRRMSRWDGLSVKDFVYAADDQGIVACVAPWSPSAAKQTVISKVPTALRLFALATRLLPSRPVRVPAPGEHLLALYLTHLTFAARLTAAKRAAVFRTMLDFLFDHWREANWHCVSVSDFAAWNLGRALGGFIQQTVPMTVYAIVPPGRAHQAADIQGPTPPAFEMAMV